jgi:hypothetical protein
LRELRSALNHQLSTLSHFWKAGRYKLAPKAFGAGCACLENKIGIAEVGALPTPSARLPQGKPVSEIQHPRTNMKMFYPLITWLRGRFFKPVRRRDNQLTSAAKSLVAGTRSKGERPFIQQDDSPPGYKIWWHH